MDYLSKIWSDLKLLALDVEHFVGHFAVLVADLVSLTESLRVKAEAFRVWVENILKSCRSILKS